MPGTHPRNEIHQDQKRWKNPAKIQKGSKRLGGTYNMGWRFQPIKTQNWEGYSSLTRNKVQEM